MEPEGSLPLSQEHATCPYPQADRSMPGSSTKTLSAPLLSPTRATCPAHLSRLALITRMIPGEEARA